MEKKKYARWKTRKRSGFPIGVILGAALFIALVSGWAIWTAQGAKAPEIQRSNVVGTEVGDIAPKFTMLTLEGNIYELQNEDTKPTIVFFMAYWCITCIPEAIALTEVRENFGQNVEIVVIDLDPSSTPQLLTDFKMRSGSGEFVWGFDANQVITNSYKVRALDTTLVIDKDGYVVFKDEWPTDYVTFANTLSGLGL